MASTSPTRNWLELPIDIFENVQKVCASWRSICKDPSMWRVIDMANHGNLPLVSLEKMCMHAVDRSQGRSVDITIKYFGTIELLHYIADRSSQLKRLHLACLYGEVYEVLSEVLKKLPLLEELTLCLTDIAIEDIETCGSYCPLLKSLKINKQGIRRGCMDSDEEARIAYDEEAVAIGKNLPELRHLQLICHSMSNIGLQTILDGCPHLESLDLRRCLNIDLSGDLGKSCLKQIKCRLPDDPMKGYKFVAEIYDDNALYVPSFESSVSYCAPDGSIVVEEIGKLNIPAKYAIPADVKSVSIDSYNELHRTFLALKEKYRRAMCQLANCRCQDSSQVVEGSSSGGGRRSVAVCKRARCGP